MDSETAILQVIVRKMNCLDKNAQYRVSEYLASRYKKPSSMDVLVGAASQFSSSGVHPLPDKIQHKALGMRPVLAKPKGL